MREQLRQEVLRRFAGAPDTQQARDLRDEILSNTLQRYDDLLAGGKSEQEAYASALESVGDVEELLSSLPRAAQAEPVREAQPKAEAPEKELHSRGMRIACAIVWPCSALLAVAIGWYGSWGYAWAVFPLAAALLHVAESVILLARGRRAGWRLVDGLLRLCICVLYAVLTAATGKWIVTWLVFPIGAALGGVLSSVRTLVEGV